MNSREQKIYKLEVKLINKYFKGLKPRPVKLARALELGAEGEAGEPNLVIQDRKRPHMELEALLTHELIHYELKDRGNVYHGHGAAFLKRAQELGIVTSYVLQRCFSPEEYEHIPTVRKTRKVPLSKFKRQVDHWFDQLLGEVGKLPDPYNVKLYPYVQNAYVGWTAFSAAAKEKSDHVIQEIWQIKKGPRGKDFHELQREYAALQNERRNLLKKLKRKANRDQDKAANRHLKSIDAALSRIRRNVERDYGVLLS